MRHAKLTLPQALTHIRIYTLKCHQKSELAQARRWYRQGYFMREDGTWATEIAGKVYQKYYTGA